MARNALIPSATSSDANSRADCEARAEALAAQSARLFATDEAAEGMSAFLAKRPPYWAAG